MTSSPTAVCDKQAHLYADYLCRAVGPDAPIESELRDLDLFEKCLLDLVARAWHKGTELRVLQVMGQAAGTMSSTTSHRRLKTLRRLGFIALISSEDDIRVKRVVPTPMALQYFAKLGKCLEDAAAGTALQAYPPPRP